MSAYDEGSLVGTAYVDILPDFRKFGPELQAGMGGQASGTAAAAGEKAGAAYGSGFAKTATAEGAAASTGIFADAEKGAVVAGLGMGHRFGRALSESVGTYAKTIGATVVGFFAYEKVKEFISGVVEEGDKAQQTAALLEAHLKSTGDVAGITAKQIEELAAQQSHLVGIDQDTIEQSAALLLTFSNVRNSAGKNNDIFTQTLKVSEDLSAALGIGLSGAMRLVGRAVNDPIHGLTLLTRYGVQFSDLQLTQIKNLETAGHLLEAQKLVLDQLNQRFAGSAKAADTPLKQLKADWTDFEQNLGQKAIPLADKAAGGLESMAHLAGEVPGPIRASALAVVGLSVAMRAADLIGSSKAMGTMRNQAVLLGKGLISWKSGAFAAGAGLEALSSQLDDTHTAAKAFLDVAGGAAMGAAFGPEGAVIGGVSGALQAFAGASSASAAAQDKLDSAAAAVAATLDKQTGMLTANTRAQIQNYLATHGAFDLADKLGVSYETVTRAVLGYKPAIEAVTAATHSQDRTIGDHLSVGGRLLAIINAESSALEDNRRHILQVSRARDAAIPTVHHMGQAVDDLGGSLDKATGKTQANKKAQDADTQSTKNLTLAQEILNNVFLKRQDSLAALTLQIQSSQQGEKGLKNAVNDTGSAILGNTPAGAKLVQNLDAIASAAGQVTGSQKIQREAIDRARQAIIDQAEQAGLSVSAAHRYADSLLPIANNAYRAAKRLELMQQAEENLHNKVVTIDFKLRQTQTGTGGHVISDLQGMMQADGGIVHFANGGENHVAQVAAPGTYRVWAEPETGGEAYIPLAPSKRPRSRAVTSEVARQLGGEVQWYADGSAPAPARAGVPRPGVAFYGPVTVVAHDYADFQRQMLAKRRAAAASGVLDGVGAA